MADAALTRAAEAGGALGPGPQEAARPRPARPAARPHRARPRPGGREETDLAVRAPAPRAEGSGARARARASGAQARPCPAREALPAGSRAARPIGSALTRGTRVRARGPQSPPGEKGRGRGFGAPSGLPSKPAAAGRRGG